VLAAEKVAVSPAMPLFAMSLGEMKETGIASASPAFGMLDPVTPKLCVCCISASVGVGGVCPWLDARRTKKMNADRIAQHLDRMKIIWRERRSPGDSVIGNTSGLAV
jgi:hypothetical protein